MPLWDRIFGSRLDPTRTELAVPFRRLDDFVYAMYEHVTSPRGLQRDRAVDFFRVFCARCHEPLDRESIRRSGSALGVARGLASRGRGRGGLRGAGLACSRCGGSKCAVELIGLTTDELAEMNADLHDRGL